VGRGDGVRGSRAPGDGVRELLRRQWFRRLYATRLAAQCADGVFQASLASAVFFNPDHQTDPKQAAAGFVVLLLPYSLVGPFAGVFLDRWRRQRVLVVGNIVRCGFVVATAALLLTAGARGVGFDIAALAAVSVNRFYLSALSASLPHVVTRAQLVLANAVTTTSGTVIAAAGGGLGLAVRRWAGSGDGGSAVVAISSCVLYAAAALVATSMPADLLGPKPRSTTPLAAAVRRIAAGLVEGARHVAARPRSRRALLAICGSRLLFGMSTIGTLLLYRNYFTDQGVLRAGLVGLGQVFAVAAVGYVAAAVVTPAAANRFGTATWITAMFGLAATTQLVFGLPFRMAPLLVGAFFLGFSASGAKICVDTTVQEDTDDAYRGRVFSLYDTGFNLTFVAAAVIAAFSLPPNGKSYPMVFAIGAGYALIAVTYAAAERPGRADVVTASGSAKG
jgi:MFS family permease